MTIKNIPVRYKDSPLGIIPQEWEVKRIRDIGQVITGNTPTTLDKDNYGDEYLFVSPVDLSDSKYIIHTEKKLSSKGYDLSRKLPTGTVLFTCIGSTIGKMGMTVFPLACNQQINAIICHDVVYNEFLFYALSNRAKRIRLIAGEQAVPIINKSDFENCRLPLPPLAEQEKIAEILSTWDKAIEKQTQLIQKLELLKKGLMQQLLTGKKRLLGFYKPYQKTKLEEANKKIGEEENNKVKINNSPFIPQGYKSTILGIIPEEWEVKKLGEILAIGNGKDYNSLESGDIPVFGTGGIICYVDDYLYCGDTVCIGRKGTIDKPIYYSGKIWTVDTLFYTYGYKATTAKYLYLLFQIINWKKYNEATGVPSLSKSTIERIMIPLPPLSEQQKIAEVLIAADREIEILQNKSEQLRQQKLGLMQQLLTGKKRVI